MASKKQIENPELSLSRQFDELCTLVDAIPHLVWIGRPDGYMEYHNQRWLDYTNIPLEYTYGDGWTQSLHPDDRAGALATWQHAVQTGTPFEEEQRLRNGHTGAYRWFLVRGVPIKDTRGSIVRWFGTCTDIDDQKRIQAALLQSQERAASLMNSNIIGIFIAEEEVIIEANDTFLHMSGYTREDLRNQRMNWASMTPPTYTALCQQAHQELTHLKYMPPYEKEYVRKDGSHLPVLVGGVVSQINPHQCIYFVLDNSARKELEQRKDDFISMASHELKAPLTTLKLQNQLVKKRLERHGLHEAGAALSRLEEPIKQLERLIGELLDVSKIQAGRLEYAQEPVDLDKLLHEITTSMQQVHTTHTITVRSIPHLSLIGDKDRLGQVFINLISNAIKYSPDATTIEIDIHPSMDTVTISVRDHGIGIPPEQRKKIFERFYRITDQKQHALSGLGMGLYIVSEIIKRHNGTITVDSEVGKGSTFHVTLPYHPTRNV